MDPTVTGGLVREFGLATGLLIALLCVLTGLCVWLGKRHIKFMDDLTAALSIQSQSMQTTSIHSAKATACLEELVKEITRLHERIGDFHELFLKEKEKKKP